MNSIETLTTFLGWSTVINTGMLVFVSIFMIFMRDTILKIHSRIFGLSEVDINRAYFQFLAQYKIAIIVFNLVPYISLKIMA